MEKMDHLCFKKRVWYFLLVGTGGSPFTKFYLWAKPKVSVFNNGQFRDLFFLRKIFYFGKNKKYTSLVNENFVLFFAKNVFFIFFKFFFYGHFFFRTPFFEGLFLGKTSSHLRVEIVLFFCSN
jgi:hypothetical protein